MRSAACVITVSPRRTEGVVSAFKVDIEMVHRSCPPIAAVRGAPQRAHLEAWRD